MGEAAPPILEARAMPRMRALLNEESEGRLRRSGCKLSKGQDSADEQGIPGLPGLWSNRGPEKPHC